MKGSIIATILVVLAVCLADAVLAALFATQVWWSFLSAQYGDGPSIGAWFGICLLVIAIMATATRTPSDEPPSTEQIMTAAISRWAGGTIMLVLAMFTGSLAGWVR